MASPIPRKNRKPKFAGNHQRSWLWGHHAVAETLLAARWPVLEVYANESCSVQFADLLAAKQAEGIPVEVVPNTRLEQLSRSKEHQGLVARMGQFPYLEMDEFERSMCEANDAYSAGGGSSGSVPLVVICDRLQDMFNFGAILRCCDGVGVTGVLVGEHSQASITPHVARASSGAVNYVPICQAKDLLLAANRVKELGFQLLAADSNTSESVWEATLSEPIALVIGSESHGVHPDLLNLCERRVSIPMQGNVTSLNAAVAAGILLYEIRRQQVIQKI